MLKRLLSLLFFMVTISLPAVASAEDAVQTQENPEVVVNSEEPESVNENTSQDEEGETVAEEPATTVAATRGTPSLINDDNAQCNAATLGSYAEGVQLWAVWKAKVYNCGAGYYLQKSAGAVDCAVCPKDSYCPGITNYEYKDSEHGREPCPAGYITADTGSSVKHSCYKTESVQCKDKNPYPGEHITEVVYDATVSNCTHYYGRDSVCDSSCSVEGLICEEGYQAKKNVDGAWECIEESITCPAGTYLAVVSGKCEECLEDSYCVGGTYSIEAKQDLGIVSCEPGLKAPKGSRSVADCGKILRIDGEALYLYADETGSRKGENPRFVVRDKDGTWYANMTPVTEGTKKVSEGATKELHVKVGNVEYTVHTTISDQKQD